VATSLNNSGVRFTLVSGAAVLTDFILALTLKSFTDIPLSVCAAITFIVVGSSVYFIHEHWTFRNDKSRSSSARLVKNLLVNCAAWTSRVFVIAVLERIHEPDHLFFAALYFGCGAALSFTINYVVNRAWVFRDRQ